MKIVWVVKIAFHDGGRPSYAAGAEARVGSNDIRPFIFPTRTAAELVAAAWPLRWRSEIAKVVARRVP